MVLHYVIEENKYSDTSNKVSFISWEKENGICVKDARLGTGRKIKSSESPFWILQNILTPNILFVMGASVQNSWKYVFSDLRQMTRATNPDDWGIEPEGFQGPKSLLMEIPPFTWTSIALGLSLHQQLI